MSIASLRVSGVIRIEQATYPPKTFIWPTSPRGITQYFGRYHTGVDISNSQKEEVYASADGIVEFKGWLGGYGNALIINHQDGYKTLYAHLSAFRVEENQEVKQRQVIGFQGNTGSVRGVTGIHLHFEIIYNGVKLNPLGYVNPND